MTSARFARFSTRDFLLEIGCEEIPADYMPGALDWDKNVEGLARAAIAVLNTAGVEWWELFTYGTPRRLVLLVKNVESVVKKGEKGPPSQVAFDAKGKPTRVAEAFAQRHGLKVSELVHRETPKGALVFAEYDVPVTNILAEAVPQIIQKIHFPKTMRWDSSGVRFARPIRWLLALYGPTPIACSFGLVRSGFVTHGTRRSGIKTIPVKSASGYFSALKNLNVHLEEGEGFRRRPETSVGDLDLGTHQKKRKELLKQLEIATRDSEGRLSYTEEFEWLLSTVTFLAEEPVVAVGSFRPEYLKLPPEVLATAMAKHLKLFSVRAKDSEALLPRFLAVLEGKPAQPAKVMAHMERILEARFTDARFFYREDTKTRLEAKVPQLAKVVFHEKLGTVEERIPRIEKLMQTVADRMRFPSELRGEIGRAARLAKADLVTQMVREFPSLQGVMGAHYAHHDGEREVVAKVLMEQYRPRTAADSVPQTALGAVLSLADRIDTLVGYFGVGLKPTGSVDPYALRRQALGAVRILLEPPKGVSFVGLSIDTLFEQGIQSWGSRITADPAKLKEELALFLRERFETLSFVVAKIERSLIAAVLDADGNDLAGAKERLDLLQAWWGDKKGSRRQMLERAAKVAERTRRIVQSVRGTDLPERVDPAALREPVEKELWEAWNRVAPQIQSSLEQRQFERATETYSALYPVVHDFFEKVFVMGEEMDLRRNRLALLREIFGGLAGRFADLSKLPLSGAGPS